MTGPSLTLLIAEDDPSVRRLLERCWRTDGARVLCARDGLEALMLARAELPQLIIMDVLMPRLNGHQVCHSLRAHGSTRRIPILMLTGLATVQDEIRALEGGADDYLPKPFNIEELRARARRLLRR